MSTPLSENDESLAGDILRGAEEIGAFVGLPVRTTFYHLQIGGIPATKEGTTWVTTKTRLRKHYNEDRYQPLPPKEPKAEPVKRRRAK
jgi:hypothetical protein